MCVSADASSSRPVAADGPVNGLHGLPIQGGARPPERGSTTRGRPWRRHAIDSTSRGADGTRVSDVDGDGDLDIACGWEEGGVVRVYQNPGTTRVAAPWPRVTVGNVVSPEDAVFVDLDGDGAVDVVSSCEGRTKKHFVHWAPRDASRYLDEFAWRTEEIPATAGLAQWMYCLPLQVDGKNGVDLIVGAKGRGARLGWLEAPPTPRDLRSWRWHPICDVGWVMSIVAVDLDNDGRREVLVSDRKGPRRGCRAFRLPGSPADEWQETRLSGADAEVMFLAVGNLLLASGTPEIVVAARPRRLFVLPAAFPQPEAPARRVESIPLPGATGSAKAVAVGDVDRDGSMDIVLSCEGAENVSGVVWLSRRDGGGWSAHEISGARGTKYDLVVPVDLDGDGDLDVLTCEERENLGVIWYENPHR